MVTTTGQNHVRVDHSRSRTVEKERETGTGSTRGRPPAGVGSAHPSTPQGVKSARKGQQGFCLPFKTFFGRIVCDITVDVPFSIWDSGTLYTCLAEVWGGIGWVGSESASDRRTGAVGGVCGAEQVIEK